MRFLVGAFSLTFNTLGPFNTANGYASLFSNTSGPNNTSSGAYSLYFNTTGTSNSGTGAYSLQANTTGGFNTASGFQSLLSNITGSYNSANGTDALHDNTTGYYNTATGFEPLYHNTIGDYNSAHGTDALYYNTFGTNNTANGASALFYNDYGNNNTAIGSGALKNNIGGTGNIAIGFNSGTHPNATDIYNTISIGNDGSFLNGYQNQVIIGNASTGFIGGKVTWSVVSDARIKNSVTEDVKGLDFILRLRPVTYHISNKAITDITGNKETPDFPGKYDGEKVKYTGFIAQEVELAARTANYDFSGYAAPKNEWGLYTVSYEQFVVPLVKAVQELNEINLVQQKIIKDLTARIDKLERYYQDSKTVR